MSIWQMQTYIVPIYVKPILQKQTWFGQIFPMPIFNRLLYRKQICVLQIKPCKPNGSRSSQIKSKKKQPARCHYLQNKTFARFMMNQPHGLTTLTTWAAVQHSWSQYRPISEKTSPIWISAVQIYKVQTYPGQTWREQVLEGVNLTGANLVDTVLEQAIYDDQTLWPQDFNPRQKGQNTRTSSSLFYGSNRKGLLPVTARYSSACGCGSLAAKIIGLVWANLSLIARNFYLILGDLHRKNKPPLDKLGRMHRNRYTSCGSMTSNSPHLKTPRRAYFNTVRIHAANASFMTT